MQDSCLQQRYSYAKIYGFNNDISYARSMPSATGISYARSTARPSSRSNNGASAKNEIFLYEA
jgi:hypothetical protein